MEASPDRARAFEALMAFWETAGVEVAEFRALAKAAPTTDSPLAPPPLLPPAARQAPGSATQPGGAIESARHAAAAAGTLAELHRAVAAFEGCGLKAAARTTVFGDGVEGAPIMLVGDVPGRDEDAEGKPFVGRAGQLLDRMLATIGISRTSNLFITNCVFWRPPGNRPPTDGEIAICLPFVERAIALARPKLVLVCGAAAAGALLKRQEGVKRLRGRRLDMANPGLTQSLNAMVMLHPSYLLHQPAEKALAWADLQAVDKLARELSIPLGERL
jgi:DNA polymerase